MKIQIELERGGVTEVVDIDFDTANLTMREAVTLEQVLGVDGFKALTEGTAPVGPSTIQALLYAKLRPRFPDLGIDDFDVDLSAFNTDPAESEGNA